MYSNIPTNYQLQFERDLYHSQLENLRKYQLLFENTSDIILFLNSTGQIIEANMTAQSAYGYELKELLTMNIKDLYGKHAEQSVLNTLPLSQNAFVEEHHQRKNGTYFSVEVHYQATILNDKKLILSVIRDITERKKAKEQLQYLATHDFLTHIPNRYFLKTAITKLIKSKKIPDSALLFIDVDNFKVVNDTYGHATGDQMLIKLSSIFKKTLTENSLLARLGGDEFAVLLKGANFDKARQIAENLRHDIEKADICVTRQSSTFNLTISIGIVTIDGTLSSQELLACADIALYAAKNDGKNRVVSIESKDDKTRLSETNKIVTLIKSALKENHFTLYYQPVCKLNNEILHYEALIRMFDSEGNLIFPDSFIPVAERFGIMSQIDRWVITEAIKTLQQHPNMTIFINLSGMSLGDKSLLLVIEDIITASGIDAARIGFEITETTAVKDIVQAEFWVRRLKELGCRFALDDFGVGFCSFSHLQLLSVDYIKIDGSFVRNLDVIPNQKAIVQAISDVAQALGKETIAESIENEQVLTILSDLKINHGQGYYLGRPSPLQDIQQKSSCRN